MDNFLFVTLGSAEGEITEKKSRFIATLREIHSEDEATAFINEMRKKYWDARHNCYAYVLGKNNEIMRFSDDKEPQGTAGKPILDVLTGKCLHNTCIVVTRYFGGILLGTGGLVRAYSAAACEGVSNATVSRVCNGKILELKCDYTLVGKLQRYVSDREIPVMGTVYAENVIFKIAVSCEQEEKVISDITELGNGQIVTTDAGSIVFSVSDGKAQEYTF